MATVVADYSFDEHSIELPLKAQKFIEPYAIVGETQRRDYLRVVLVGRYFASQKVRHWESLALEYWFAPKRLPRCGRWNIQRLPIDKQLFNSTVVDVHCEA
ncbi:hypothetical protein [Polaromonas sp. JS666]|uniref:hypothetical protein n=1 Tax=Polaromonas sp. (strain JS666 / ATCC BAA-500) TaxID=296591 RepID=UPI0008811112|nr:hypothetical protein [Polaromonas sp. JS666]SDM79372.1 hypothetical protein SAMN05720382_102338 [Polaromonas sp. JS666]